jgi:hypothetical protein
MTSFASTGAPTKIPIEARLANLDSRVTRLEAAPPASQQTPAPKPGIDAQVQRTASGAEALATDGEAATPAPDLVESNREKLKGFNVNMLKSLACAGREFGLAYQLGRSLRFTANIPEPAGQDDPNAASDELKRLITDQLARNRVSKLQEWLATLAQHLPADSALIVDASLGRWCDFAITIFDKNSPGSLRRWTPLSWTAESNELVAKRFKKALLPQGDTWLNLLVGTESTEGLLTPEGVVASGEAALSRTVRIIRRIVLHYWFALFLLAAALAAILIIAARDLGDIGKFWTQVVSIAGALGVTGKGIGSALGRLSESAEKPIYAAESLDAKAWAVTSLPQVRLTNRGVWALRRSGIQKSGPLGHV